MSCELIRFLTEVAQGMPMRSSKFNLGLLSGLVAISEDKNMALCKTNPLVGVSFKFEVY